MQAMVRKSNVHDTLLGARVALHEGLNRIYAGIPKGRGWATYPFNTLTLGSQFQPILSVADRCCVAYEGLLVGSNLTGYVIKPETVFALSANHQEELFLDWLCRGLHLRNFRNIATGNELIFLNAYPEAAIEDPHHPRVFSDLMEHYGIQPRHVVMEILETGVSDEAKLVDAVNLYRSLGCQIAIDDFGIGYSNFDRLWRLKPEFVKIDRSVTMAAVTDPHARMVLANMVKLIHTSGAKVIIEGIETRDEALIALDVGADFVQGYFFARPGLDSLPAGLCDRMFESLQADRDAARRGSRVAASGSHNVDTYARALNRAILELQLGVSLTDATESFRQLDNVQRVYLAYAITSRSANEQQSSRYLLNVLENPRHGLVDTANTGLSRLGSVFELALAAPEKMHVLEGGQTTAKTSHAITLTCAFEHEGQMAVLCGDLRDVGKSSHANVDVSHDMSPRSNAHNIISFQV